MTASSKRTGRTLRLREVRGRLGVVSGPRKDEISHKVENSLSFGYNILTIYVHEDTADEDS